MVFRQLSQRCVYALRQAASGQAAEMQQSLQQHCGKQSPAFQQLAANMRQDGKRHHLQVFQPSRLYPKQHSTGETAAFWGLLGLNVATTFAAKADQPEVKQLVREHFRTSVEAIADGRYYTLLTSTICHTSAIHCIINLLVLVLYRRTQPLTACELLVLYVLGGLVSSITHVTWCWWDASGYDFGLKYALNSPGLLGCSGAVAAITAYKAALEPMGVPHTTIPMPVPVSLTVLLYCCLFIREQEYSDYAGKWGAAAFGIVAAVAAVGSGRRRLVWRQQ
eukprot:GHRR01015126.1.p1 GENE.GHRR01015126.1~~GHRR01015126.1.p1  ORF type:complete len:278 (+),score=63.08 GHRR01015126.1:121-954(+)